jgi:glycosyltransferase involved in cell wall biosynthesis
VLETRLAPPLYRGRPVVTLADASRDELVHLGFDPAFVHVVPPGIDPSFSPDPARRSPTPLVVTVGRLAPVKRFVLALAAAEAAHHRVPDLEVVVVGEGPDRPELERWIADRDAGGWVRLAGRIDHDELVDLYRRAWVALSASLAEGWGMTLTEAGACATPAVATDVVGHRGAVVPGITGELVETVADLGIVLADLLTEPTRRDRYGRAAAERARTLTWDRTAHDTLAILLNETRRRALAPSEGGG